MAQTEVSKQATPLMQSKVIKWLTLAILIYLILVAVSSVGSGFKIASQGSAQELFNFAENPFLGLIIGMVATALVQSSSTVSSIIVGLVAGGLPIGMAIPMIMGANIGTSVTNTFVSLGHIRNKGEFRKAFAGATIHDFFNLLSVLIFFPLEIAFGILEKISNATVHLFSGDGGIEIGAFNFVKAATEPTVSLFKWVFSTLPEPFNGVAIIFVGIFLIIFSITVIGKLLKSLLVGRAKMMLHSALGKGPISGIASGTVVTILVQSSSTTTSLAVPLVGSGVFSLRNIYPFTLGANIGTCITALIAATAVTGEYAVVALQIALVHLFYNVLAVTLIYSLPVLRELPIKMAESLARRASEQKAYAFGYVAGVFFILPFSIILIYR